ncbi:hypothetical protein ILYODFUR_013854 [Ilyodon furcidens]|uniref:Uncharacterized protein n=1 Tax=Ilyodon furcidens TaxID=33524 RepID=A0ABV0V5I8_9TELE
MILINDVITAEHVCSSNSSFYKHWLMCSIQQNQLLTHRYKTNTSLTGSPSLTQNIIPSRQNPAEHCVIRAPGSPDLTDSFQPKNNPNPAHLVKSQSEPPPHESQVKSVTR